MFTDMVGYTALTQSDEAQALAVLERHNRLLRPIFPKFRGKEIKTIGDSFLIEFDSALDATNCAVEVQRFLHDYNVSSSDEWKIRLRIGLHLGDVEHREGDIFGDAVNIASRLQPLADPEGICISGQVYDQVRNKANLTFIKLEPRDLKGIKFSFDLYGIVMPWEQGGTSPVQELSSKRIAVLPFANLSPDPGDEYFADGLTEELIDRLCQIKELAVIARTSVMNYKRKEKTAFQIGRELRSGVLVEGSLRKAGNKIRVTAQLINANTEEHIWSSHYDRELEDIFTVQSDIAENIASALRVQLLPTERAAIEKQPTQSIRAHAAYLKGLYFIKRVNKETFPRAIELFEKATVEDPGFAAAYAALADCYTYMAGQYMPFKEAFGKAKPLALKAIDLDDTLADGHASLGNIHLQHDWHWADAERELTFAIELNPSYSTAHLWHGIYLCMMRKAEAGVRELQTAEELDPLSYLVKMNLGFVMYFARRYDEALAKCAEAVELESRDFLVHMLAGLCHLERSDYEAAMGCFDRALTQVENDDTLGCKGFAYAISGRRKEAEDTLARIRSLGESAHSPLTNTGIVQMGLGEYEKASELFESAVEGGDPWLVLTCQSPLYDRIRSTPRFVRLLENVGLPQ